VSFAQSFVAADNLFLHILFNEYFKYWDSTGEGGVSKVEGLHPTDARAYAGKSAVMCGAESGKRQLREDPTENSQN
jgi:hypothetical protein